MLKLTNHGRQQLPEFIIIWKYPNNTNLIQRLKLTETEVCAIYDAVGSISDIISSVSTNIDDDFDGREIIPILNVSLRSSEQFQKIIERHTHSTVELLRECGFLPNTLIMH